LTERLLSELKTDIGNLKLIPSRGGCFEIWADEQQIYSKLATGEFPDESAILAKVQGRLGTQ
jgi:selT/selW/selH-like putative selenoprotein